MKTYTFSHQLGTATIKVNNNGTAVFNRKKYSSYNSARKALTNYYGFSYIIKKEQ